MQQTVSPNIDPADEGSLAGVLKSWLKGYIREHHDDMLPATVVSYDDAINRAVVRPLIMVGTTDGRKISRGAIPNIPVFRFGGGGFFVRFPIKPGDFGWIKANDRDVSLMFQRGGQEDWPNTERLHSFSDAMFFPDTLKDWAIDGENSDALVIQSMTGAVCVSLHEGELRFKAPRAKVEIPDTEWIGNIAVTGNVSTSGGNVDMSGGSLRHNGKNIGSDHSHTGVQRGNDSTGGPS
ncbi:Gp138 family membrane-puncturing spike protein [Bordetella avium]|uniref:Phage baseplate protein n=2 Tax=Bordetella avium TaxID=521 RepID=Q2L2U9_BORA1|nr:Gp138 family membrane-puncturing spike protein [Bordetella avium]CAJ48940.1 Putative phage baseplate protein [Bordetella avium 197N]